MVIFSKKHILRKFEMTLDRGRESLSYKDCTIQGDVQNPSDQSSKEPSGSRREPRIKAWTDIPITPDDQLTGKHADWIWYDEKWWKCVNCRYSGNTLLSHYVSEFVRVPENEPAEHRKKPEEKHERTGTLDL